MRPSRDTVYLRGKRRRTSGEREKEGTPRGIPAQPGSSDPSRLTFVPSATGAPRAKGIPAGPLTQTRSPQNPWWILAPVRPPRAGASARFFRK